MIASISFEDETSWDQYLPRFLEIVRLARTYIEAQATISYRSNSVVDFLVGPGIVTPLRIVAFQCRDRQTRREAIALLRRANREGIWDPKHIAAFGEWILGLEEQGLGADEPIPEHKRVRLINLDDDFVRRRTVAQVVRQVMDTDGNHVKEVKEIAW